MKSFLETLKEKTIIGDGAFGTYLNQKGRPPASCRSEENLKNPELVISIHKEYIEAGADVIETNTFDANIVKLSQFDLEDQFVLLNRLAVQNAKKAARGTNVFVAGSLGPTNALLKPYGKLTEEDYRDIFSSQAKILINEGVDLLIFETFSSLIEIEEAVKSVREFDKAIPIVANITILEDGLTKFGDRPDTCFKTLLEAGADVVGINCTLGPAELFNHFRVYFKEFENEYLSAMPNAGYPIAVGDKIVYPVSENYFKEYGILFIENGIDFFGGCCGTTPTHIKKLKDALKEKGLKNARKSVYLEKPEISDEDHSFVEEHQTPEFFEKLGKEFVISVEVSPPRGVKTDKVLNMLSVLKQSGVDAVNVAENPLARVRMSAMVFSHFVKRELGLEPILHITCRDKNLLGMQSDLLGAYALGIRGILALTGDPTSVGDFPEATGVFDIDSVGILEMIKRLNNGFDFGMNKIKGKTDLYPGAAFNPLAPDIGKELSKLEKKIEAGAFFLQTQPVYNEKVLEFLAKISEKYAIPVLVGVLPLKSYAHAVFLNNEFPGIEIPEHILKALYNTGKDFEKGKELAADLIKLAKDYVSGVYIMPPFNKFDIVKEILS